MMNCISLYTWFNEVFSDGQALANHPVLPLPPVMADVDWAYCVDILMGIAVAVRRSDGGFGGELEVIGDLRSIASLWVIGKGVSSVSALF